jgi:hypothetical protein
LFSPISLQEQHHDTDLVFDDNFQLVKTTFSSDPSDSIVSSTNSHLSSLDNNESADDGELDDVDDDSLDNEVNVDVSYEDEDDADPTSHWLVRGVKRIKRSLGQLITGEKHKPRKKHKSKKQKSSKKAKKLAEIDNGDQISEEPKKKHKKTKSGKKLTAEKSGNNTHTAKKQKHKKAQQPKSLNPTQFERSKRQHVVFEDDDEDNEISGSGSSNSVGDRWCKYSAA